MPDSDANGSSRIFISYRRDETAYPASWLYDRLKTEFGGAQIFKESTTLNRVTTSSTRLPGRSNPATCYWP